MPLRLAVNGLGRIGRLVIRALVESGRDDLEIVAINNRSGAETGAHLLKYDSVHGRFPANVHLFGDILQIDDRKIRVTSGSNLDDLPWSDLDIDVVLECTGKFTKREAAAGHLAAGARKVLISAPGDGADKTIVYGVNHESLTPRDTIVSCASCTTNCLAPVAKVLHETFGIEHGFMTTVHAYTNDQPTLDSSHKDIYRARAAAMSMIPTKTGAAKSIGLVIPDLDGRLDGSALRVPTPNVSAVDLTVSTAQDCSVEVMNAAFHAAAQGSLSGVLGVSDEKLVSIDFNHDPHSAIVHTDQTRVIGNRLIRILAWYDNEWGFSCRMLDVAALLGR